MLTVLGEALIDLVADPDGRYTAHPGGSPLNVAIGLARLGHPTEFMARLSTDGFGRRLADHAHSSGVRLNAAPRVTESSTLAVVAVDELGHAEYDFYVQGTADWQWTESELDALPPSALVHTGSLAAWIEPGAGRIAAMTERVRAEGGTLLSYDPNVRPRLLGDPTSARALIERSVSTAHIVKCSEEDLSFLYPARDASEIITQWLDLGASVVVVTLGADGVVAGARSGAKAELGAVKITLADTIGAGDAFMSGLLASFVEADVSSSAALDALTSVALSARVADATLVAALTCEQVGANPPTAAQREAARSRLPI
jgi:fructokinase